MRSFCHSFARFRWVALAILASLFGSHRAPAAIVGFSDYAAFQTASFGSEIVNNFDSLGAGTSLTTIGDTMFSNSSGAGLRIYATDGIDDDTVSSANYVGNGNVLFRELENETVTISFTSPRSSVGVFVIHNTGVASGMRITGGGTSQFEASPPHEIYIPTIGTAAYFMGLVDDTGANSISSFTLRNSTGSPGYFFDSQTSFTAVPEPSSIAFCGLVVAGVARRHVRKRKQHS